MEAEGSDQRRHTQLQLGIEADEAERLHQLELEFLGTAWGAHKHNLSVTLRKLWPSACLKLAPEAYSQKRKDWRKAPTQPYKVKGTLFDLDFCLSV